MSTDLDAALRGLRAHARQKFAMLGLHPSQHYSAPLVAAVIDGDLSDARWLMHLLTTPGLVERAGPDTWVMPERVHHGARAYAEYLPEAQTTLATMRLVRHYARCATGATHTLLDHGGRPTEGAERAAELAAHALGIWHAHGHGQISHSGGQAVAAPTATAHFEDALPRIRAAIDVCDDHSDAVQTALCLIRALLASGIWTRPATVRAMRTRSPATLMTATRPRPSLFTSWLTLVVLTCLMAPTVIPHALPMRCSLRCTPRPHGSSFSTSPRLAPMAVGMAVAYCLHAPFLLVRCDERG